MTFLRWKRIVPLTCLWLTIQILLSINYRLLTSFGQTSSQKLEGTEWKGTVDVGMISDSDSIKIDCSYLFRKDGKVKVDCLNFVSGYEWKQQYNSIKGTWEQAMPVWNPLKSVANGSEICDYKQTGKSINIKCDSRDVDAKIQNNKMEGKINLESFRKTTKWLIERVSREGSNPAESPVKKPND